MIPVYQNLENALEKQALASDYKAAADYVLGKINLSYPDAIAVVLFVNLDFSSSHFGKWTALPVGPSNTIKAIRDAERVHLKDLPSQRQYPAAAVVLKPAGMEPGYTCILENPLTGARSTMTWGEIVDWCRENVDAIVSEAWIAMACKAAIEQDAGTLGRMIIG